MTRKELIYFHVLHLYMTLTLLSYLGFFAGPNRERQALYCIMCCVFLDTYSTLAMAVTGMRHYRGRILGCGSNIHFQT